MVTTTMTRRWSRRLGALMLMWAAGAAQALALPAPGYEVEGFAMLYGSPEVALSSHLRPEFVDAGEDEAVEARFLDAVQPVRAVTGVDLYTLPVPFKNALSALSIGSPESNPLTVTFGLSLRTASFSNLVLDLRTLTLWGDLTMSMTSRVTGETYTASRSVIPVLTVGGGLPVGTDFRSDGSGSPLPYWPENAPFAMPVTGGPATLPDPGIYAFESMGADAALIWLPDLRLTPQAVQVLQRVLNPQAPLGTSLGNSLGDMVIAVKVSAVPEPGGLVMALFGVAVIALKVRRKLRKG